MAPLSPTPPHYSPAVIRHLPASITGRQGITLHFAAKYPASAGPTKVAGSVAALISVVLGTWGLGKMGYSTTMHEAQPHAIEAQLVQQQKQADSRITRSALFDLASGGIKNTLKRFVTGNMASDKAKAVQAFKLARNAQITAEDNAGTTLQLISGQTGSSEAMKAINQSLSESRTTRKAYFDLMQDTVEYAYDHPSSWIGKALHAWEARKLADAETTLTESDHHILNDLIHRYGNEATPENALAFYQEYVDKIVAKHAPDQVEACKTAGNRLAQDIHNARTAISEEALSRENLLSQGMKLSGIGLLGLLLAGALMANRPQQE